MRIPVRRFVPVIAIAFLVLTATIVSADIVFSDSFDTQTSDSGVPDNWTLVSGSSGDIQVTENLSVDGNASVEFDDSNADNDEIRPSEQPYSSNKTQNVTVSLYAISSSANPMIYLLEGGDSFGDQKVLVRFENGDSVLESYNGSGWVEISSVPEGNEWINVTIYDFNTSSNTFSVKWKAGGQSGTKTDLEMRNDATNGYDRTHLELGSGRKANFDKFRIGESTQQATPTPTATATATDTEQNPDPVVVGTPPPDCSLFCNPIFSSPTFFLLIMIGFGGVIGLMSKRLAIAGFGSYILFVSIASNVGISFFTEIMYLLLVIFLILLGMQVWQYATGSEGGP